MLTITGMLAVGGPVEGHDCVHPAGRGYGGTGDDLSVAGDSGKDRPLDGETPESFEVHGNYPNPFNPATEIRFSLPEGSHVTVDVFNIAGQKVVTLVDRHFAAGGHSVAWNGRGTAGQLVASGVYFYRIRTDAASVTRKMLLIR